MVRLPLRRLSINPFGAAESQTSPALKGIPWTRAWVRRSSQLHHGTTCRNIRAFSGLRQFGEIARIVHKVLHSLFGQWSVILLCD